MSEEKYDLVFKGQLAKSADLAQTKRNLATLFKISPTQVEGLFSGRAVVLKRNLDAESANRYRVTIKKAGALVDLVAVVQPKAQNVKAQGRAVFGPQDSDKPQQPMQIPYEASSASRAAESTPVATETVVDSNSPFTLAPPGADVLAASERHTFVQANIDTSEMTLKAEGGTLLNPDEYAKTASAAVVAADLDVAPVGADVLKPEERQGDVAVNIDTSELVLAEPGVRLSKPKPEPPPAPDVSKISLVKE